MIMEANLWFKGDMDIEVRKYGIQYLKNGMNIGGKTFHPLSPNYSLFSVEF